MESLEISARTVEEAIQQALERLGVSREEVEITVLEEGRSGLFGLGSVEARVRVTPLAPPTPLAPSTPEVSDVPRSATEVLETILEHMGVAASVKLSVEPGVPEESGPLVNLNIEGDDLGILIGRRGQTLSSLQYLVRIVVAHRAGKAVPINIDVEGYKQRRSESLQSLALRMANQVRAEEAPFTLEPMPAYERRLIHLALANNPDVTTYSVGDGDSRKVVIAPKKTNQRR